MILKDLVDSIVNGLPQQSRDVRANVEALVQGALGNLDLVTREQFDIQQKVLERSRNKVTELEARLKELEEKLDSQLK